MSYVVKLTSKANRQYKNLPGHVQDDFLQAIDELSQKPTEYPFLTGKFSNLRKFKFRAGGNAYRAVFTVDNDIVLIAFLGTREGFYAQLEDYMS